MNSSSHSSENINMLSSYQLSILGVFVGIPLFVIILYLCGRLYNYRADSRNPEARVNTSDYDFLKYARYYFRHTGSYVGPFFRVLSAVSWRSQGALNSSKRNSSSPGATLESLLEEQPDR